MRLTLAAGSDGSTIRGLAIGDFAAHGIAIQNSSNNVIAGNFLGTDASGSVANSNQVGISVSGTSTNNTIGGTTPADRNIISANTVDGMQLFGAGVQSNVIAGNYIGLDVTGTIDMGNTNQGISIFIDSSNNTVGGTAAGAGNVISGNNGIGIAITADTTVMWSREI